MEIQFYHLLTQPLEVALPKLLLKAQEAGLRSLVLCRDAAQVKRLDELLWTFSSESFLAHGAAGEPHEVEQPILLSTQLESKSQANFLVVVNDALISAESDPDLPSEQARGGKAVGFGAAAPSAKILRLADMFDGGNPEAVASARQRWKVYKEAGHSLSYYRQQENGGWKKEA